MAKADSLKQFLTLQQQLAAEREQLNSRLQEIDQTLAVMGLSGKDTFYGPRTPTGRIRNEMSLKKAVLKVIDGKALTKQQILEAVRALGYQFSTHDPLNSLGIILYGKNPVFKNTGGHFSLT